MVFSSIVFLLYFLPVFLLVYALLPRGFKNYFILLASMVFYAWGAPKFIFVILGTTFVDFILVRQMWVSGSVIKRKLFLSISVLINVGLLVYFKYSNFFVDNVNVILAKAGIHAIPWVKLILPIGISFYTFETITYVVDVYRRVHAPVQKFTDYLLYIILFPKLIAGPIIPFHSIADQVQGHLDEETSDNRLMGLYRFSIGLAKKVLIANQVGLQADAIFSMDYHTISTYTAWIGILAYTFQIYFDFSGYSDMALGLGKIMGFSFPENFNNPYISQSIIEFWRRWHITLGNWMRNYLYIPLGGNRVPKGRLYFNLWLVFLASGLWHGASWNFIIWGAYHGTFLVLERIFLLKIYARIGRFFRTLVTFIVVATGWVFFRVAGFGDAIRYIKRMYSFDFKASPVFGAEFYMFFIIAAFFAFFAYFRPGQKIQDAVYYNTYSMKRHFSLAGVACVLLALCIGSIASFGFNPFIYFRF